MRRERELPPEKRDVQEYRGCPRAKRRRPLRTHNTAYAARNTSLGSRGLRQRHNERRAAAGIVVNGNGAAMRLHDPLRNAQTEAVAARLLGTRAIHSEEWFKEARHVGLWNARTIISHGDD